MLRPTTLLLTPLLIALCSALGSAQHAYCTDNTDTIEQNTLLIAHYQSLPPELGEPSRLLIAAPLFTEPDPEPPAAAANEAAAGESLSVSFRRRWHEAAARVTACAGELSARAERATKHAVPYLSRFKRYAFSAPAYSFTQESLTLISLLLGFGAVTLIRLQFDIGRPARERLTRLDARSSTRAILLGGTSDL